jgi:hypothetical protein
MVEPCVVALCGRDMHNFMVGTLTVLVGVFAAVIANWVREGGTFQKQYFFVGADLTMSSIVTCAGVILLMIYTAACAKQTLVQYILENPTPYNVARPALFVINARLLLYCRNQQRRALISGVTFRRGVKNTFVGVVALTLSMLAF